MIGRPETVVPSSAEVGHWLAVAFAFPPWRRAFWLGLLHDTVEDGYLPRALLRVCPALDAITRRDGECYQDYIDRVSANPLARQVKLADLADNLRRNGGPAQPALAIRYRMAVSKLELAETMENAPCRDRATL